MPAPPMFAAMERSAKYSGASVRIDRRSRAASDARWQFQVFPMDVLADIFETIQLKGTFYFRTHFSPPWGTTVDRYANAARFHYVMKGRCWIRVEGGTPIELAAGDFVLVPSGASHVLADQPRDEAPPLETVIQSSGYRGEALFALGDGDPRAATQLVCGHV